MIRSLRMAILPKVHKDNYFSKFLTIQASESVHQQYREEIVMRPHFFRMIH